MENATPRVKLSRNERKRRYKETLALKSSTDKDASDLCKKISRVANIPSSAFLPLGDERTQRICIISYDGTEFNGYQAQIDNVNIRTVQGCIEDALKRTTNEIIRVHCASRTDKG